MTEKDNQQPKVEAQNREPRPHKLLEALGHGYELYRDNTGKVTVALVGCAAASAAAGITLQSEPAMALVYIFTGAAAVAPIISRS